jgi:putative ABC transport system substrate-binding protein
MLSRRWFLRGVSGGLLAAPVVTGAQQGGRAYRLGFLSSISVADEASRISAFRQRLQELGYAEGRNIVIESRYAEGDVDRLPRLATELVRLAPDIIVTWGPGIQVVKDATSTIPIVMMTTLDAVAGGLVESLVHPGGNVTGLTLISADLMGKRFELLKEALPRLRRVALLTVPPDMGQHSTEILVHAAEVAAKSLQLQLQVVRVRNGVELDSAFRTMARPLAGALYVVENPTLVRLRVRIVEQATKRRLPTMFGVTRFSNDGGLLAYGPDTLEMARRAAGVVDKILKGAKPADLPVEQPTKFELVINLKTAKALGLTIPPSLRARADQIIE